MAVVAACRVDRCVGDDGAHVRSMHGSDEVCGGVRLRHDDVYVDRVSLPRGAYGVRKGSCARR